MQSVLRAGQDTGLSVLITYRLAHCKRGWGMNQCIFVIIVTRETYPCFVLE
jgi:hypothetical protein